VGGLAGRRGSCCGLRRPGDFPDGGQGDGNGNGDGDWVVTIYDIQDESSLKHPAHGSTVMVKGW